MKTSSWSCRLSSRKRTKKKEALPKEKEGQNSSRLLWGNLSIGLGLGFPRIWERNFVMQV